MTDAEQSLVAEVHAEHGGEAVRGEGRRRSNLAAGPLAFKQNPNEPWAATMNRREWRTVEVASGSGHGNARGVARIYGALGSAASLDGVTLMSKAQIEAMTTEQHNQTERYRTGPTTRRSACC